MSDPELTRTAAAEPGPAAPPQRRIGRYAVEKMVGEGGMGVVYAAHDPDLDRRVAVKVLRGASSATVEQRARLLREARAMARLTHRNVVTVHEVGTDGDVDFVAMELLEGGSLGDLHRAARARGALSRREVLSHFRDAGRGLAAAHAAGLVHRDFKPHNVLVARDGRVVVTDFGLARAVGVVAGPARSGPEVSTVSTASDIGLEETRDATASGVTGVAGLNGQTPGFSEVLTRTGSMVGTPAYMPPEQFAGEAGDPRADQFAFCVALWESLCGERPFAGDSIESLRRAVSTGVPTSAGRGLPGRFRRVLARGLAPEPARRWPSMDALLAALDRAERLPRRFGMVGIALIAAVGTVALFLAPPHPARPTCALAPSAIDAAWSPARRGALPAAVAAVVAPSFDRVRTGWLAAQHAACAGSTPHPAALACLDEAGQELGALVDAAARSSPARVRAADVAGLVPDLDACRGASPLAVTAPRSPAAAAARRALRGDLDALQLAVRAYDVTPADAVSELARLRAAAEAAGDDVIVAEVAFVDGVTAQQRIARDAASDAFDRAALAAERGGHGLVYALAAIGRYDMAVAYNAGPDEKRALRERAAIAVLRAGNPPSLTAEIDLIDAEVAHGADDDTTAIALAERGLAAERARGSMIGVTQASTQLLEARRRRGAPGDVEQARAVADAVVAEARAALGTSDPRVLQLLASQATQRWHQDPAAAAALLAPFRSSLAAVMARAMAWRPSLPTAAVTGVVELPDGRPAAGAEVSIGRVVLADSVGLDPMLIAFQDRAHLAHVVTDRDGRFRVDVPAQSVALAALGDLRSPSALPVAGSLTLRLGATGGIRGRVRLEAPWSPSLAVGAQQRLSGESAVVHIAPVARDGSFALSRLPPGRYFLAVQAEYARTIAMQGVEIDVKAGPPGPPVEPVWSVGELALEVIVRGDRSVPVPYAQVVLSERPVHARTLGELRDTLPENQALRIGFSEQVGRSAELPHQPGDLTVRFAGVSAGAFSICVVPLGEDPRNPAFSTRVLHDDDLDVVCERHTLAAAPAEQTIVVVTPPMKRLAR